LQVEPPGKGDALRSLRTLDAGGTSLWWRCHVGRSPHGSHAGLCTTPGGGEGRRGEGVCAETKSTTESEACCRGGRGGAPRLEQSWDFVTSDPVGLGPRTSLVPCGFLAGLAHGPASRAQPPFLTPQPPSSCSRSSPGQPVPPPSWVLHTPPASHAWPRLHAHDPPNPLCARRAATAAA
jgi:hypothetical protein